MRIAYALLSFFVPGLGQLCKGQILNGIAWFFVVLIGYMMFIVPGIIFHLICIAGAASGPSPQAQYRQYQRRPLSHSLSEEGDEW